MTVSKQRLSVKAQTIATLLAIAGAVVIPQIFHVIGAVSGMGTALGEAFLPMHLPIILVGLIAGPYAGAISGLLGPLASFALSGMPPAAMLPFMMTELFGYGLCAGLLRNVKMPTVLKVLIIQVAGRLLRAAAILVAVYVFGRPMEISTVWTSITAGLFGIVLQLVLIPLTVYRLENIKRNEK